MKTYECRICSHREGTWHEAGERMFNFGGSYPYFECAQCGCLQLTEVPTDLSPFYPAGKYYSFSSPGPVHQHSEATGLRGWIARHRNRAEVFGKPFWARLLTKVWPRPDLRPWRGYFDHTPIQRFDQPILDIGCGGGALLRRLHDALFTNLTGVDPFLAADIALSPTSHIHAKPLEFLTGRSFDFIMMNDSLEHMPDQIGTLKTVGRLLSADGVCVIKIPVVSDGPWKRYGVRWVELDAPRHLFLHSKRSMRLAAEKAGMEVFHTWNSGDYFPYIASELYLKDIPLYDDEKKCYRNREAHFTPAELEQFRKWTNEDAARDESGHVDFYLRRKA
ncbi:MAG: class I SAM-dependent methyltransferase [Phycisphaeraceae bacterium]